MKNGCLIFKDDEYVLFDELNKNPLGYARTKVNKNGYVIITHIATVEGFGALLHDIVIMNNFPNEVTADDDLTQGSINIWNFYYNWRDDVVKSKIPESCLSNEIDWYDEESLKYSYRLEPTDWFRALIYDSEEIIETDNQYSLYILGLGRYLFTKRYGDLF
jgi:hypothetical protein